MRTLIAGFFALLLLLITMQAQAGQPPCDAQFIPSCDKINCCSDMGGISYCDSSAGRYVCNNGFTSSCYCTRHAVMDLQKIQGCCLWQGGVMDIDPKGLVICNNGGVSETCSLEMTPKSVSVW